MEALTAYREFVFASQIQGIFEDPHLGIEDQELTVDEYRTCTKGFIKHIERLENRFGYHGRDKDGGHLGVIRSHLRGITPQEEKK